MRKVRDQNGSLECIYISIIHQHREIRFRLVLPAIMSTIVTSDWQD
jgi:hypothetical protein